MAERIQRYGDLPLVYAHPRRDLITKVHAVPPNQERRVTFRPATAFRMEGFALLNGSVEDWFVHSIMIGNHEQLAMVGQKEFQPIPLDFFRGDNWRGNTTLHFMTSAPGSETAIVVSHCLDTPADIELMLCGAYTDRS